MLVEYVMMLIKYIVHEFVGRIGCHASWICSNLGKIYSEFVEYKDLKVKSATSLVKYAAIFAEYIGTLVCWE